MLIQTTVMIVYLAAPYNDRPYVVAAFDARAQCSEALDTFEVGEGLTINALICRAVIPLSDLAPRASPRPMPRPVDAGRGNGKD